jgi:hypothetical protein
MFQLLKPSSVGNFIEFYRITPQDAFLEELALRVHCVKSIQLLLFNPAQMTTERLKFVGLLWRFKHIKMLMFYLMVYLYG